ncbi:MAG: hypothetical protein GY810_04440 [Aureispira sp.]|nr:hypothetical protein [Aureispira sp.]
MSENPLDYFEPERREKPPKTEERWFRWVQKANWPIFPAIILIIGCTFNLRSNGSLFGELMSLTFLYALWITIATTLAFLVLWAIMTVLRVTKIISPTYPDVEYPLALFLTNIGFIGFIFLELIAY